MSTLKNKINFDIDNRNTQQAVVKRRFGSDMSGESQTSTAENIKLAEKSGNIGNIDILGIFNKSDDVTGGVEVAESTGFFDVLSDIDIADDFDNSKSSEKSKNSDNPDMFESFENGDNFDSFVSVENPDIENNEPPIDFKNLHYIEDSDNSDNFDNPDNSDNINGHSADSENLKDTLNVENSEKHDDIQEDDNNVQNSEDSQDDNNKLVDSSDINDNIVNTNDTNDKTEITEITIENRIENLQLQIEQIKKQFEEFDVVIKTLQSAINNTGEPNRFPVSRESNIDDIDDKGALENYFFKNTTEIIIVEEVATTLKHTSDICKCGKCFHDICAIALNSVPSHYVTTERGELLQKATNLLNIENLTRISTEIFKAIDIVRNHPSH